MGIDHGDAGENHVAGESGEHGFFDIDSVLNHDYDGVAWCDCRCDERFEGRWDIRAVFGYRDDVVEWWEVFFRYVWYGVQDYLGILAVFLDLSWR